MYAVEVASCGIIFIPTFMKNGAGVQALLNLASEIGEAVMLVLLI
jgi:hypothetical protein